MAMQLGPNLLDRNLLSNPADPQGTIRDLQNSQGGGPFQAKGEVGGLPSFGKEFMQLLQSKAQSEVDATAAASSDKTDPALKAAKTESALKSGAQVASDLLAKTFVDAVVREKAGKKGESTDLAAQLAAAQMLAQSSVVASTPKLAPVSGPTLSASDDPQVVASPGLDSKTGSAAIATKGKVEGEGDPLKSLLKSEVASMKALQSSIAKKDLQLAGLQSEMESALKSGKPMTPGNLGLGQVSSTPETQAVLSSSGLQLAEGDELELETDSLAPAPLKSTGVSTMDHLSGKDFLHTWNSMRPQATSDVQAARAKSDSSVNEALNEALSDAKNGVGSRPVATGKGLTEKQKFQLVDAAEGRASSSILPQHLSSTVAAPASSGPLAPAVVVNATVTQGASAQNRMTSESVNGLSQSLQQMTVKGQEQGQIRIRLKPDSLGEIHLKVATRGNQVELQVQASDENARRIIEGSLGDLRDHLASKNLSLATVDMGVMSGPSDISKGMSSLDSMAGDPNQGRQDLWSGNLNDDSGRNSRSRPEVLGSDDRVARPLPRAFLASPAARVASGRLDVLA